MAIIVVEQPAAGAGGQQVVFSKPRINFQHFTTPHGGLLLVQFVVGIIIFIVGSPIWLDIVNWIAWIVTHLLIWMYLFSLNERYTSNPPLKVVEFYFNAGAAALFALSTLFCFIFVHWLVAPFAIANTVAYGASAFFLLGDWTSHRGNPMPTIPK